jgi:ABC-2 type transport system ATP-binding protein
MADAIVAENLTFRYGDLTAVDHIDFNVAEGEIFGFLGPNGAGKSTTIKMLTGQMRPKEGKALVLGMDVAANVRKVRAEIGVWTI